MVFPTFIILVPVLIAVLVVIIVAITRSTKGKYKGAGDARNFDDGTTFYPGDAVVNPTSTPPPRKPEVDAPITHPLTNTPQAEPLRTETGGQATASPNVISDGLLGKADGGLGTEPDGGKTPTDQTSGRSELG